MIVQWYKYFMLHSYRMNNIICYVLVVLYVVSFMIFFLHILKNIEIILESFHNFNYNDKYYIIQKYVSHLGNIEGRNADQEGSM